MDNISAEIDSMKASMGKNLEQMRRKYMCIAYAGLILGIIIAVSVFFTNEPAGNKFFMAIMAMVTGILVFILSRKLLKDNLDYLEKKVHWMTVSLLHKCSVSASS